MPTRQAVRLLGLAIILSHGIAHPRASYGQSWLDPAFSPARGALAEAEDSAHSIVEGRLVEMRIPGLSIAVAVGGRVVWAEGFGWADVENRVPVDPDTKFRIASISKALAAAAVGKLHEEGRLDLDAPVQAYVPGFPEKRWRVTTRQLAGHVAGIRHYGGDEFMSRRQYDDVVDALVIFQDDTLLFQPGSEYSYSTYGWNLVSAVVQGASGERFLSYMREHVLEPLGMTGTVAEHADSLIAGRARFYTRGEDGRLLNAPWVNNSNKWAGGGYLSTATDMVVYGSSYLRPGLLSQETIDLLFRSQKTADGQETGYGIGWSTGWAGGRRAVWHTGGAMGGSTVLLLLPDDGVVVSILTNVQSVRHTETARAVAQVFAAAVP